MAPFSTVVLAFSILHLTLCQQHEKHHHKHKRRDAAAATTQLVTQEVSASYDIANIIVYVNDKNQPVSTTTIYKDAAESTPGPAKGQDQAPPPQSTSATYTKPFSHPDASKNSGAPNAGGGSSSGTADSGGGFVSGVTYSPYNQDHSCKSEGDVAKDLADIGDFQIIRLYGTDCNQLANVLKATKGKVSIFAGVFDIKDVAAEVNTLASATNGNWNQIKAISVGNELVNTGSASVEQVTSAVNSARSALKAKGYTGPITTVDTMMALQNHPQLCFDFCAINCHAFFDGNVLPGDAGKFVANWAQKISQAAGGKRCVVTESGWPTQGTANNKAIPGKAEHQQAIQSLRASFSKDLILFTLYDDLWKQDRGDTHGAEKWWGLRGH